MYCMKCGAKLSDREVKCPLCGFDLPRVSPLQEKGLYPRTKRPRDREDFKGMLLLFTLLYSAFCGILFLPVVTEFLGLEGSFAFLSFLFFIYIAFVLPRWFIRPNPVIFFPVSSFSFLIFLFVLDLFWGDGWFFFLALPLIFVFVLLVEAVVTLSRYLTHGRLYIYGGFFIALGGLSLLGEVLYRLCFSLPLALTFSLLAFIIFASLGMGLIIIAIVPPFRRFFERRFFV